MLPDFITKPPPTFPDHVEIRYSKRARRLNLRLNPQTQKFDLTLPQGTSLHRASDFTAQNEAWMQAQLAKLPQKITFTHGQTIPILGKNRAIHIQPHPTSARTFITLEDDRLLVQTKLLKPAPKIEAYLKSLAKTHLTKLTNEKAAKVGKQVTKVSIRDTKSRWGSCSSDGRIMYSWRLILAPSEALDYVVAHEVAHLKHLDHSKQFWSLCRSLSNNHLEGHHWMQELGHTLMRYG